jgi:hypothetical protein
MPITQHTTVLYYDTTLSLKQDKGRSKKKSSMDDDDDLNHAWFFENTSYILYSSSTKQGKNALLLGYSSTITFTQPRN